VVVLAFVALRPAATQPVAQEGLALVGATIYVSPTDEPLRNGVVLVRDGKITGVGDRLLQVPPGFQVLDCSGRTITAGFWNSHVHFFERKWADAATIPADELTLQLREMFTSYGFTNVFDIGSPWDNTRALRDRIESGEVAGPRIRSSGQALLARGAMPPDVVLQVLGDMVFQNLEVASAAEARAASRQHLHEGVDALKVHLQPPRAPNLPISPEGIREAVVEAHERGKPVFVHPNDAADVLAAVLAGVDVVAHTTPRSAWDESILKAIKDRNVALTPTLALWRSALRHDRIVTQKRLTDVAISQLRSWVAAGGAVLFGNDAGASEYDPIEEYQLMARAGMSFRDILASLTTSPALRFGESEQGTVTVGTQADLVVLKGDPAMDVQGLADVEYTIRGGKIVFRASESSP
jgi:imidazolonepropionase-like amidohydrolase